MNIKLLISISVFSFSSVAWSQESTNSAKFEPLSDVRVSMQRMLRSVEGRYFLDLYAGIWNPHGTLYDLRDQNVVAFKGSQKADQLHLKSVKVNGDSASSEQYQLSGHLDANTGNMATTFSALHSSLKTPIQFEPAFKAAEKPRFVFKFYGLKNINLAGTDRLKQVDVMNKLDHKVVQSLTNFDAYPKSIGYMDINFDGYYDVVLSDISNTYKVEDKRFIYWMYNPKTGQFQRSPQLENIVGFPSLHGEKQQIDFGNGQIYQVADGLLNRLE